MANRSPPIQECPKHEKSPGGTKSVQAPFMPFEKPFDDMQDLPDPRAYPKDIDEDLSTSPTKDTIAKSASSEVKDQNKSRPWPLPDKNENPSKRKRDIHISPLSPHHQNKHSRLDRWLDEPGGIGPYHAIDSILPTKKSYHVNHATEKKV